MRLALTTRHLPVTAGLEQLAERRAQFILGPFSSRLAEVRVRLSGDGAMVGCLATACLMPGELLAVHGTYSNPQSAVSDICERLSQCVARAIERRRQQVLS
jgi:hypothetical protein